jgi:hypothetical protein
MNIDLIIKMMSEFNEFNVKTKINRNDYNIIYKCELINNIYYYTIDILENGCNISTIKANNPDVLINKLRLVLEFIN